MKLFISKKFILSLTVFYGLYNIYSCAAIQSPPGGPKDNIPPILLHSIPENGSINFSGGKVDLVFSEYLQEKSIYDAITILPKTKISPESINRQLKDEH